MLYFDFPVYLASSSPRRYEILKNMIASFEVIESNADETNTTVLGPKQLAKRNSLIKLQAAQKKITSPSYLIIAADTIVTLKGQMFGKPCSRKDAIETLKTLGNQTHEVITGVSIELFQKENQVLTLFAETSLVSFNYLSEQSITSYVDTQKPFDKAGSYGIQELPTGFVHNIKGDFNNIVGLPSQSINLILSCYSK